MNPALSAASPLYERVKRRILSRIAAGELVVGDRVPSENEIVKDMGVSRMTAHRALGDLTREGVLERRAGVGSFVADRRAQGHPLSIRNIADEIKERGHVYTAKVLLMKSEPADGEVARALDLALRSPVFHSRIVHCEDGTPLQLEDRWVNPRLVPRYLEQDFKRQTPYEYLTRVAPLQEVEHRVRAVVPDASTRRRLQMTAREPCLLLRRRTWTGTELVSFALLYHPGGRYELGGRFRPQEK